MNITDKALLYKIVCARDKRYDGRFYCGVHTTGVYCRPICPARPKFENITFYRSSAEAEKEGFRACLRCRPDLAPNSAQWNGTAAIVGRALMMISRGDADQISIEQFAEKLGVTDRHLRRLFEQHVGASPNEVATSKRLHLAALVMLMHFREPISSSNEHFSITKMKKETGAHGTHTSLLHYGKNTPQPYPKKARNLTV